MSTTETPPDGPPPEAPAEPYVDPYRQVISPFELPANPVAAQRYVDANPGVVDETVVLPEDRQAQAEAAIQAQQDNIDEAVASIPKHPSGGGAAEEVEQVAEKAAGTTKKAASTSSSSSS